MSLTARLQFGDNSARRYSAEYMLADYKCQIVRRHNEARPDGKAKCEHIELTVITPGKEDLNLIEWYVNHSSMSGRILIERSTAAQGPSSQWKEVIFENGVCYAIAEEYHIDDKSRRELRLSIAVEELTVDDVVFIANP